MKMTAAQGVAVIFFSHSLKLFGLGELAVVVGSQLIGGVQHVVHEDQTGDTEGDSGEQTEENVLAAIHRRRNTVLYAVAVQTLTEVVIVDDGVDATGNYGEQEQTDQASRMSAVGCANGVEILSPLTDEPQAINAAGNNGEKDVLNEAAIGSDWFHDESPLRSINI